MLYHNFVTAYLFSFLLKFMAEKQEYLKLLFQVIKMISPTSLAFDLLVQKNFYFQTGLVGLI